MQWKVTSDNGEVTLNALELLDLLFGRHLETKKDDFEYLALELCQFFENKRALHEVTLLQLVLIAFSVGYFYRIFWEKNNVELLTSTDSKEDSSKISN